MVEIFKALADTNRLRILYLLMQRELCVCEIEALLNLTQSNASRHLTKLMQVGMINRYKEAQWVYYRLSDSFIKNHQELITYIRMHASFEEDLRRLMAYKDSGATCLDIRGIRQKD